MISRKLWVGMGYKAACVLVVTCMFPNGGRSAALGSGIILQGHSFGKKWAY